MENQSNAFSPFISYKENSVVNIALYFLSTAKIFTASGKLNLYFLFLKH
jgi:hypothetical protein